MPSVSKKEDGIMKKQYLYAGTSIVLWSTTATVTKLLLGSLSSMQVLCISSFFSVLFLLIINAIKGNFKYFKEYSPKDFLKMALVGTLGTFLYNLFLIVGISMMPASQAFIINYLWPMMAVVFGCVLLKEAFTARKFIAVILSFVGVIVVTSNGNFLQLDAANLKGALLCVCAAVFYGLFTVLNKKNDYDSYFSMLIFHVMSFGLPAICMAFTGESFLVTGLELPGLLWIGVVTNAIAFTTWALALKFGDTAKVSNLAYITPFLSLIWTSVVLKEPFNLYSLLGLLLIVTGIVVQMGKKK